MILVVGKRQTQIQPNLYVSDFYLRGSEVTLSCLDDVQQFAWFIQATTNKLFLHSKELLVLYGNKITTHSLLKLISELIFTFLEA